MSKKEGQMTRADYISIDKNLLLETYENNGRSLRKTAKVLGVSEKTIKRRFKRSWIKIRSKGRIFFQ